MSGDEVQVSFGGVWLTIRFGLVVAFCLALGGFVVFAALFGDNSGAGGSVAGGVIGGVFLLFGLVGAAALPGVARPRHLVFDGLGVTWNDRSRRSWSAAWQELALVRVTTAYHRVRFTNRYRVRLIIRPTDIDAFAAERPELSSLRARNGAAFDEYSLTLGPSKKKVPQLADGLNRFAGSANGGVIDEGRVIGFGYS